LAAVEGDSHGHGDENPVDCPTALDWRVGKDSRTAGSLPGSLSTEGSWLKKIWIKKKKNCQFFEDIKDV
jgi:hypothetical protein